MTVARTMLTGIYEHSRFTNGRLLDQAQQLSDEELDAGRPGMFGTIRATLLHMMQAQHSWLRRVNSVTGRFRFLPLITAALDSSLK